MKARFKSRSEAAQSVSGFFRTVLTKRGHARLEISKIAIHLLFIAYPLSISECGHLIQQFRHLYLGYPPKGQGFSKKSW
jgi:hypothetical protein